MPDDPPNSREDSHYEMFRRHEVPHELARKLASALSSCGSFEELVEAIGDPKTSITWDDWISQVPKEWHDKALIFEKAMFYGEIHPSVRLTAHVMGDGVITPLIQTFSCASCGIDLHAFKGSACPECGAHFSWVIK